MAREIALLSWRKGYSRHKRSSKSSWLDQSKRGADHRQPGRSSDQCVAVFSVFTSSSAFFPLSADWRRLLRGLAEAFLYTAASSWAVLDL